MASSFPIPLGAFTAPTVFNVKNNLPEGAYVNADNISRTQALWGLLDAEKCGTLRKDEFKMNLAVWAVLQECGFDENCDGFITQQEFVDNFMRRAAQYLLPNPGGGTVHDQFVVFERNLNIAFGDLLNQLTRKLESIGVVI
jgi:hypothetical protein